MKLKPVVFNADDFGRDRFSTDACEQAFENGMLTSVSLISITREFKHAAKVAKKLRMPTGAHVVIAVEHALEKIYNKDRRFPLPCVAKELQKIDPDTIFLECCDQIEAIIAQKIKLTHIDFHKNTMTTLRETGEAILKRLYEKYKTPIVIPSFHNTDGSYKHIRYSKRIGGGSRFRSKYLGFVRLIKWIQRYATQRMWVPVHLSTDKEKEKWRVCEYQAMLDRELRSVALTRGVCFSPKKRMR